MRRTATVLAMVVLLAAACGGGSKKSAGTAKEQTGTPAGVVLSGRTNNHGTKTAGTTTELEQDDFYFEPTFVKAAPGQKLTIELKNEGKVAHTFTSGPLGVDVQLAPGETKDVALTAPASGFVEFHCRFHQSQGMRGAVFVGG